MSGNSSESATDDDDTDHVILESPRRQDGAALWRIARDTRKLDLNSSYAYLLWCHDFADTSVVARVAGRTEPVGFVLGYRRQRAADSVVVWQVAVDGGQRGRGLAGRMLDALYVPLVADGTRYLETTITPDNTASIRLFGSFAERWNARLEKSALFAATDFPDEHEAEEHYRIGPLARETARAYPGAPG